MRTKPTTMNVNNFLDNQTLGFFFYVSNNHPTLVSSTFVRSGNKQF